MTVGCEFASLLNLFRVLTLLLLLLFLPKDVSSTEKTLSSQPPKIETSSRCGKIADHFFIIGQYLYWQANLSGLELSFGSSSLVEGTTNGISFTDSKEFNIDPAFDWTSGLRLGCGGHFPNSNWSLSAFWTQFKDKGRRSIKAGNGITNKGSCKVSLEQIDAIVAYASTWTSVTLEPFIGVRAVQINHSVNSQVTTTIVILPDTMVMGVMNFDDHQCFKGIGPALGLDVLWMVAGGFGLYGEGAFNVLYGNYKITCNDSDSFSSPLSSQSSSLIDQHLHRFNTNIDLALGIFWRRCIYDKTAITLSLGYEFHEYYNLSNLSANKGDLSFNGAVASFEIAF